MKVLWITNGMFSHHFTLLNRNMPASSSGSWLYAAYAGAKNDKNIELHIATVSSVDKVYSGCYEGASFYILPGGSIYNYDIESLENRKYWQKLKNLISPDLMVIWGSEARFSYLAMQVFNKCTKLIYVQGVMNAIVGHLDDAIPHSILRSTLRDYIDIINPRKQSREFIRQAEIEKKMFKLAQGAIIENDWCESQCLSLNSNINIYNSNLPIRDDFYQARWDYSKIENFTIFTNAGTVPYKGHHILFQALTVVKKSYPQVKLYIPGGNYLKSSKSISHRTGYFNWLHKMYNENHLEENIVFTGTLTSKQMAEYLKKCHVYVMPSMIENHSSSLIEAMIVGTPCVTSMVGGTASLINNGENGFMYNSLEYMSLAGYIIKIFCDPALCEKISLNAFQIREKRNSDFGIEMSRIYKQCINK